MQTLYNASSAAIVDLASWEIDEVTAASIGDAAAAGLAGAGATATIAWIAGAPTGGLGAAAVVGGGFLLGVALYYITD